MTKAITNTTVNQNVSLDTQNALPDLLQGMVDNSLTKMAKTRETTAPKTAELSQIASSGEEAKLAARQIAGAGMIFEMR